MTGSMARGLAVLAPHRWVLFEKHGLLFYFIWGNCAPHKESCRLSRFICQKEETALSLFRLGIVGVLLLSNLFFSSQGFAADYYVDPVNGSDLGDGSMASPWLSLQWVIDEQVETQTWSSFPWSEADGLVAHHAGSPVQAGDTIYLMDGYHGTLSIIGLYNLDFIRIAAAPGHQAQLGWVLVQGGGHWPFDGLEISPMLEAELNPEPAFFGENHSWRGYTEYITIENSKIFTLDDVSAWSMEDWNLS